VVDDVELTIFTIATNQYFDYLISNLEGLSNARNGFGKTQLIVATNTRNPRAMKFGSLDIQIVEIEDLAWPDVTLLRYEVLLRWAPSVRGRYLIWLDADMDVIRPLDVVALVGSSRAIYLAVHPGFHNTPLPKKASLKVKLVHAAEVLKLRISGQKVRGTWETRKSSNAYVSRKLRRQYVHGAVWLGQSSAILQMAETLSLRTRDDLQNGIVAVWHDESHLNWFYAHNRDLCNLLPEHFSAWVKSPWFDRSLSWILSVDKSHWK